MRPSKDLAGVLEVAHKLLFCAPVLRGRLDLFGIDMQRIVELAQQTANCGRIDGMASVSNLALNARKLLRTAAAHRLLRRHWIARRFASDHAFQDPQDQRRPATTHLSHLPRRLCPELVRHLIQAVTAPGRRLIIGAQ
jgi:hypothetical protein